MATAFWVFLASVNHFTFFHEQCLDLFWHDAPCRDKRIFEDTPTWRGVLCPAWPRLVCRRGWNDITAQVSLFSCFQLQSLLQSLSSLFFSLSFFFIFLPSLSPLISLWLLKKGPCTTLVRDSWNGTSLYFSSSSSMQDRSWPGASAPV